jgi:S1-C subfamily serine protease
MTRVLPAVLAAALGGALAGAAIGVALSGGQDSSSRKAAIATVASEPVASVTRTSGGALTPEAIYRTDAPGVVVITDTQTETVPPTFFSPSQTQRVGVLGSGFVVDTRGDIVTNDHVVQGASAVRVGFSGGATYPATIVGTDPSTDIAVVRVKAPSSVLHPLVFGSSSTIQVGEPAYAIGNPFGLDRTMTAGIVSATGRDIQAPNGLSIPNAIQTDAAINHGNSGGPLIDRFGRVIGINSQIEGGTVNANVGVGFAVPSDTARTVADELITSGHAEHAWLGVRVESIDPSVAKLVRGLPKRGVVVASVVKDSPAAKAGLLAATRHVTVGGVNGLAGGDSIVALAGKPITSSAQLADLVATHRPGDSVTLTVVRDGRSRTVHVTLGNVPDRT